MSEFAVSWATVRATRDMLSPTTRVASSMPSSSSPASRNFFRSSSIRTSSSLKPPPSSSVSGSPSARRWRFTKSTGTPARSAASLTLSVRSPPSSRSTGSRGRRCSSTALRSSSSETPASLSFSSRRRRASRSAPSSPSSRPSASKSMLGRLLVPARQLAAGAQELAEVVLVHLGAIGRRDEVVEQAHELARGGAVREVPRALEGLEAAARDQVLRGTTVRYGDDRVPLPPQQHRRYPLRQVEPVGGVHVLAARIHDPAQRPDERSAGADIVQRREAAPHLVEVGAGAHAESAEEGPDGCRRVQYPRRSKQRQDELGTRQSGRPQHQVHLAPEPAARYEHEPLAALRELVGHLHGHSAAQRVADDRAPSMTQRAEKVADATGVGAERVVAARLGGSAVA